jgi:hypothetical protein
MSVNIDAGPSFRGGVPQELFELPPSVTGLSATGDLKRFLAAVPMQQKGAQSFNVMVNWTAGLKN